MPALGTTQSVEVGGTATPVRETAGVTAVQVVVGCLVTLLALLHSSVIWRFVPGRMTFKLVSEALPEILSLLL